MKISETPNEIRIEKGTIPDPLWRFLFPLCLLLSVAVLARPRYFASNHLSLAADVLSVFLSLVFPALFIRWRYYSDYPSTVHISQGCISIRFRRLFKNNQNYEITAEKHPTLVSDCFIHHEGFFSHYYYARVQIESTIMRPIVLYIRLCLSEKEAIFVARQFAQKVVSRTGFRIRK
jgi:hypothetical protein